MKIRDLLADPSKWTQGAYARDAEGNKIRFRSGRDSAVCWCLQGAVQHCYDDDEVAWRILKLIRSEVGGSLPEWNDGTTLRSAPSTT